jgi:hypothetical protein
MMPSYATLDRIADTYLPVLFVWVLAQAVRDGWNGPHRKCSWWALAPLLLMAALVYGTFWLDRELSLWHRLNLDYSTHTAASAALCYLIWRRGKTKRRWLIPLSLLLYLGLMRYQNYHTWGDMVSTLIYVGSAIAIGEVIAIAIMKKWSKRHDQPSRDPH